MEPSEQGGLGLHDRSDARRIARGREAILHAAWRRLRTGLRRIPLAKRTYHILKYGLLCRGPYQGEAEHLREQLQELCQVAGSDRLPISTDIPQLAGWLEALTQTSGSPPQSRPRRLLLFGVMPGWVPFCLPLAVLLAGRGCQVDYVWLPYQLMELPNLGEVPVAGLAARLQRLFPFVRLHPRLSLVNFLHVRPSQATEAMRHLARQASEYDARYLLRCEYLDSRTDPKARNVAAVRAARNLDCLSRLETLLRRRRYDSLLIPNSAVYEFGVVYQLARRHGFDCVSFDFCERKGVIIAHRNRVCVQLDTEDLWQADEPHLLIPEREAKVMQFLLRREKPNWEEGDYTWQGQTVTAQPEERLKAELGLAADKPVALLCTNIAYDTAVLGQMRAFPSMADWVRATVAWFVRRPDWQLVVRCHPAEATYPSGEPVPELIRGSFPTLPDTIRVVEPADRVNTYGLMRFTDLGLVYTTTVGLEMAVRGIPVIVAGKVHYAGKGFTTDPANSQEYVAALERATGGPIPERLSPRAVELARCYADVYFHRLPKAFPWYIGTRDQDMQCWSMKRLIAGDCPQAFLETLDFLAGNTGPIPTSRTGGNF